MTIGKRLIPLLLAGLVPFAALADMPGKHPGYLHALSDLRAARWFLWRPGGLAFQREWPWRAVRWLGLMKRQAAKGRRRG